MVGFFSDCGEGWFECDLGQCILELFVCDGQPDCSDASDEGHQCGKISVKIPKIWPSLGLQIPKKPPSL